MAKTPEGAVKEKGRKIFSEAGYFHFPVQQGATSRGGIPDDMVCLGGLFLQVEYKAHMRWDVRNESAFRTLPTLKQVLLMEEARASGAITWVIDDTTIDLLSEALKDIRNMSLKNIRNMSLDSCWVLSRCCATFTWKWSLEDMLAYREGKGTLFWCDDSVKGIPEFVR